jgi:hypothetical protein
LEWEFAASPPITANFAETPVVNFEAYHYSSEEGVEIV